MAVDSGCLPCLPNTCAGIVNIKLCSDLPTVSTMIRNLMGLQQRAQNPTKGNAIWPLRFLIRRDRQPEMKSSPKWGRIPHGKWSDSCVLPRIIDIDRDVRIGTDSTMSTPSKKNGWTWYQLSSVLRVFWFIIHLSRTPDYSVAGTMCCCSQVTSRQTTFWSEDTQSCSDNKLFIKDIFKTQHAPPAIFLELV